MLMFGAPMQSFVEGVIAWTNLHFAAEAKIVGDLKTEGQQDIWTRNNSQEN